MKLPRLNKLSVASQLSLLSIVILLGAVFVTVNSALQQQSKSGHAATTTYNTITVTGTSSHNNGTGNTGLTLVVPAAAGVGDVVIAQVVVRNTTTCIKEPTGWTLVRRSDNTTIQNLAVATYKHVTTLGNAGVSYTWNFTDCLGTTVTREASGGMAAFSNVDSNAPIVSGDKFNFAAAGSTVTMSSPSITTTTPGKLVFVSGIVGGTSDKLTVASPPTNMTQRWITSTANTTAYVATQDVTSATTLSRSTTSSPASDSNITQLLALTPTSTSIAPTPTPTCTPPCTTQNCPAIMLPGEWFCPTPTPVSTTLAKPTVTIPACIADGYTGSGVKISWTDSGITGVDLSQSSTFSPFEDKPVSGVTSTTAPNGYIIIVANQQVPLSLSPNTTYFVRTNNGKTVSTAASFSIPACTTTPTNTPTPSITIVPTKTPTPTPRPTVIPTPTSFPCVQPTAPLCPNGQLVNVSPTPPLCSQVQCVPNTPSPSVSPLPSIQPGDTLIAVTVGLHGIGTGGDSANPGSTGNTNPLHPSRTVTADVYDVQNQLVVSQQGTVDYDSNSGKFLGTVDLGQQFATGLYTIKIKTDQFLRALVPGIQTIGSGQTTSLPDVTLIAGDVNGDNVINIEDYNLLIGCYSDLLPAVDCTPENNVLTDLNDDGSVNQFDYNLFLRELTNIGGQ